MDKLCSQLPCWPAPNVNLIGWDNEGGAWKKWGIHFHFSPRAVNLINPVSLFNIHVFHAIEIQHHTSLDNDSVQFDYTSNVAHCVSEELLSSLTPVPWNIFSVENQTLNLCYSLFVTLSPVLSLSFSHSPTFICSSLTGVLKCRQLKLLPEWKSMTSASGSMPSCEMSSTLPVVRNP